MSADFTRQVDDLLEALDNLLVIVLELGGCGLGRRHDFRLLLGYLPLLFLGVLRVYLIDWVKIVGLGAEAIANDTYLISGLDI